MEQEDDLHTQSHGSGFLVLDALRLRHSDGSSRVGKPNGRTAGPEWYMTVQPAEAERLSDQVCVIMILEL